MWPVRTARRPRGECVSSGAHRLGLEVLGALDERLEGGDELVQPLDVL